MAGSIEEIYRKIGENDLNQSVRDYLTTGLYNLNHVVSGKYTGGLPVGRITEIYGSESSGKTLMATMAMIEAQKKDGIAIFLDYEHAFDVNRAVDLGLDTSRNKWIFKQPETAEQGFYFIDIISNMVRRDFPEKYVCIIIDSVASMTTKAELEAGFQNGNMKTRLSLSACLSSNLKLLTPIVNKTNVTLIFLNQTRENPGVMFGDKTKTAGGNALKFYSSVRLKLSKTAKVKNENGEITGEVIRAQTVKNKISSPFRETLYVSDFLCGIDLYASHIEFLKESGFFGSTTGWLEFNSKKYRQKELLKKCRENRDFYESVLADGFLLQEGL